MRFLSLGIYGLSLAMGNATAQNRLSPEEEKAGWQLLFDGKTTTGWRGYGSKEMPKGWQVVEGALTRIAMAGDIITTETFDDFELRLEWQVAKGGNSGIFYRGVEGADPKKTPLFYSAPEMQVLDDALHPDGKSPLTSAGASYGLYPAPRGVVRPAGEWNAVRIVVKGDQVEHWLNGTKVVEYLLGGPDWLARVKASKFVEWPAYGKARSGVIGLQDHGDRVAYRSIRILKLR